MNTKDIDLQVGNSEGIVHVFLPTRPPMIGSFVHHQLVISTVPCIGKAMSVQSLHTEKKNLSTSDEIGKLFTFHKEWIALLSPPPPPLQNKKQQKKN